MLFINASEHFDKDKRQNRLSKNHINKIIETYQNRSEEDRYSRRVKMDEIVEENKYNLNLSRYVSTAIPEPEIDLSATHAELAQIETDINQATRKHNAFLEELGLHKLP